MCRIGWKMNRFSSEYDAERDVQYTSTKNYNFGLGHNTADETRPFDSLTIVCLSRMTIGIYYINRNPMEAQIDLWHGINMIHPSNLVSVPLF
jgi:hypothetical protein